MKPITHLDEDDLEELFSRASGPGGQNVNKVSTRVSLRHRPTGITVHVQDARTQAVIGASPGSGCSRPSRTTRRRKPPESGPEREKARRRNRPKPAKVKRIQVEGKRRRSQTKQMRRKVDD